MTPETPSRQNRASLRTKAAVRVSLLTAIVITVTGGLFFFIVRGSLEEQLAKRGQALAKSIGRSSELALFSGRGQEAAEAVDPFFRGDDDVVYVILLDKEERPILARTRRGHKELSTAELVRLHRAIGAGPIAVHDHIASRVGILGFTEVVRVRRTGVAPELIYEEEALPSPPKPTQVPALPLDGGGTLVLAPLHDGVAPDGGGALADGGPTRAPAAAEDDLLPEITPAARTGRSAPRARSRSAAGAPSSQPEEVGRVLIGLSKERLNNTLWTLGKSGFVIAASAIFVLVAGLFYASRRVFRRIERMVDVAYHISRGDLTRRVQDDSEDELGRLGEALNRITTSLGAMMGRVQAVTGHLTRAVETLAATSHDVVAGARVQAEAAQKTQDAVEAMTQNLRTIATDVGGLSDAARQSAAAVDEMTALNQEVLREVVRMTSSTDGAATGIEEMAASVREVAASVEAQSAEAARMSRSMGEMDLAIREVQKAAHDSADLSDHVRTDAEEGAEAVERLLHGIRRIDRQGISLLEAMSRLGEQVRSIGDILNLIDEISEQVNLLSLNASIIAAQAGEHGKAFAGVVDEIKELSDRTSAATRQVAQLVRGIRAESENAAHEVEEAARNTRSGMRLTSQAEEALAKIVGSASRGATMAKVIARATEGQAHGSQVVTDAAQRIAGAVSRIAEAATQQARTSDRIAQSAVQMRDITQSVDRSCNAEAKAAEDVSLALGRIARMVESLQGSHRTQSRSAEDVRQAIEHIRRVAEGHREAMATLERAMGTLAAQSKTLETELDRFMLSSTLERTE
jgi:methyl-accepting chemotaxis protein